MTCFPSATPPPAGGEGEEFFDEFDDPPYEWRPETFYAPGDPERGRVTFADVGGMEELKEEIRLKITYPLNLQYEVPAIHGAPLRIIKGHVQDSDSPRRRSARCVSAGTA